MPDTQTREQPVDLQSDDTQRKFSSTKTISDTNVDKKTSIVIDTLDHSQKKSNNDTMYKTEVQHMINADDKTYTNDTVSFKLKKVEPVLKNESLTTNRPDTRFTSFETETVMITRTNDMPNEKHHSKDKHPDSTEDDFLNTERHHSSTIMSDTVSSSLKKVRPENVPDKPREKSPAPHPSDQFKTVTDTIKITLEPKVDETASGKRPPKKTLKKSSRLDIDVDEEDAIVTETEEHVTERKTSSYQDDTISFLLKKVSPSDHPTEEYHSDDDNITTSNINLKKAGSDAHPLNKSPVPNRKTSSDHFTSFETETVKITRSKDDDIVRPMKKPLKKDKEIDEEFIESEKQTTETFDRRTSTYTDDTISSTLKKVCTVNDDGFEQHDVHRTEDDFTTQEKIHSSSVLNDTVSSSLKKINLDEHPENRTQDQPERFTKYETEIVKNTRTVDDNFDRPCLKPKASIDDFISKEKIHISTNKQDKQSSNQITVDNKTRSTNYRTETGKIIRDTDTPKGAKKKATKPRQVISDSESDDEEIIVIEQYHVDTLSGKRTSYIDDTFSSNLKKVTPDYEKEKHIRTHVGTDEEADTEKTSNTIVSKKIIESCRDIDEPRARSPAKKPYDSPKSAGLKKDTLASDRTAQFISNKSHQVSKKGPTSTSYKKPCDKLPDNNDRFTRNEERYTSNTVRHTAPTKTQKAPVKENESPRMGSIVEITIDVKKDVDKTPSYRVPRPIDKKNVIKTKTQKTTVRKEIDALDSDELYFNNDVRTTKRPTDKRPVSDTGRKTFSETITIKKDLTSGDTRKKNKTVEIRSDTSLSTPKKPSAASQRRPTPFKLDSTLSDEEVDFSFFSSKKTTSNQDERRPTYKSSAPQSVRTPDVDTTKSSKYQKKCIATKTINLTSKSIDSGSLKEDIIIDIQKAKSSREPSPNKLIPVPVSPDDEKVKTLPQRYPDRVIEPDDFKPKRKPIVKNIPIFEEQSNDFVGLKITELEDSSIDIRQTSTNYIHTEASSDDDVANLSVSQKVNHFISEAEKLKTPSSPSKTTDFERPYQSDFDRKREKFMSEKIIEEASESETETIIKHKESIESRKVSVTKESVEKDSDRCYLSQRPNKEPAQKVTRESVDRFETKENERPIARQQSPGVTLKSTEAVKKAKAIFETKAGNPGPGTTPSKPRDITGRSRTPVNEDEFVQKNIKLVEAYEEKIIPRSAYKTHKKESTPERRTFRTDDGILPVRESDELISASRPYSRTPSRENSREPSKSRYSESEEEHRYECKESYSSEKTRSNPYRRDSRGSPSRANPPRNSKSSRPSEERNRRPSGENPHRNLASGRSSEERGRRPSGGNPSTPGRRLSSDVPSYMKDTVSSKKDIFEKKITSTHTETFERCKSMSPQVEDPIDKPLFKTQGHTSSVEYERSSSRELPSYMSPTVSSLVHSNRKFSIETHVKQVQNVVEEDERIEEIVPASLGSKKLLDSKQYRKSSSTDIPTIEDVYDLEILERMLETVVGYEQRRRIRVQIRLVKKLIMEGKLTQEDNISTKLTTKTTTSTHKHSNEQQVPETQDFEELESYHTVRNITPSSSKKTTTTTHQAYKTVNKQEPKLVRKEVTKTVSSYGTPTKKVVKESQQQKQQCSKSTREEYGVTPTFQDGLPLFGLKALRKRDGPAIVQSKGTSY